MGKNDDPIEWDMESTLNHRGRVMHICISNLTIIGLDNGLSPSRRQAIIWTNAGILFIRTLGTNFSEILIEIHTFSFKKCLRNGNNFVLASMCWSKSGYGWHHTLWHLQCCHWHPSRYHNSNISARMPTLPTRQCHDDNLQCHQGSQRWHHDNSQFSM